MLRRGEAKMIAEELFALIRTDIKKIVKEMTQADQEEYLDINQAAALLRCSPHTLYKTKEKTGYTKFGNKLRFRKSTLLQMMKEGKLKGPNV